MYRVVLDTNVIVSGLRSRRGASFRVLSLVGSGKFEHCLSVALALEYEDAIKRSEAAIRLRKTELENILDYLCASARQQEIHFLWRPTLSDPNDDMVLEVAVHGACDAIVTFNVDDFRGAESFGIKVVRPQEFLKLIGGKV
jgi:putative PIN family toxin of toxin-antitoxin system